MTNNRETFSMTLELREAFRRKDSEEVALPLSKLILEMYDYIKFESRSKDGQRSWLVYCGAKAAGLSGEELEALCAKAQDIIYDAIMLIEEFAEAYIEEKKRR